MLYCFSRIVTDLLLKGKFPKALILKGNKTAGEIRGLGEIREGGCFVCLSQETSSPIASFQKVCLLNWKCGRSSAVSPLWTLGSTDQSLLPFCLCPLVLKSFWNIALYHHRAHAPLNPGAQFLLMIYCIFIYFMNNTHKNKDKTCKSILIFILLVLNIHCFYISLSPPGAFWNREDNIHHLILFS